jgi:SAM-dependent methyltransferase
LLRFCSSQVADKFDLYNHAYRDHDSEVYREIRLATYGRDFGQTSWVSTEEADAIPGLLNISAGSRVLEIGFGSGHYALYVARVSGCSITGLEINPNGVATAEELAHQSGLGTRAAFQKHDVSERLPFDRDSFDAAFSNDVFCHVPDRLSLLRELYRVLRPGGRLLFSDALVIGGLITNEELAVRSSIGLYIFTPPGVNENLLEEVGFHVESSTDTTSQAAVIAERWRDARRARAVRLVEMEGKANYEGLQRFLSCTVKLTSQNRLRRYVYRASKKM